MTVHAIRAQLAGVSEASVRLTAHFSLSNSTLEMGSVQVWLYTPAPQRIEGSELSTHLRSWHPLVAHHLQKCPISP